MFANTKLWRFLRAFSMIRLKVLLVGISAVILIPGFSSAAEAGPTSCLDLVLPLDHKVSSVKDRGGIWALFEKGRVLRNHSPLALQFDSKVHSLMFTLNYLCETEEGIPYGELSLYLNSRYRERGGEGPVKDELLNMGYSIEEVTLLLEFKKYAEKNRHRKLEINQIKKTMDKARGYVDGYLQLSEKIKKSSSISLVEEMKALGKDIDEFRATDPYMKQADYENSQEPHTTLTETSDQM